jgi:hypothetical protein
MIAPGHSHFALLRRSGFQGPLLEVPSPEARAKPNGRRKVAQEREARSGWVAYYSPLLRATARQALKKELDKPKEEQSEERITALKDAACFTSYVRKEPKIRHQRGMLRRLAKHLREDFKPDGTTRAEQNTNMGPAQ